MANQTTNSTNDLIPKEALREMEAFEQKAKETTDTLAKLLAECGKLNKTLKDSGLTIKGTTEEIKKYEDVEKEAIGAFSEIQKIEKQKQNLHQKMIALQSKESKELEKYRQELQKKTRDQRNAIKEEQAAAGSIDQLRAKLAKLRSEYNALSKDARSSDYGKKMKDQIDALNKQIKSSPKSLQGSIFAGAFWANLAASAVKAIGQMINKAKEFALEGVEMASKGEGILRAFNRLDDPGLLDNLRKATRGTINDLELMKTAVRAENFGIPFEKLGTLLKFAQQRAQDTGESVDYLADSIITGLGRKSVMILDNLQISTARIQEEAKKTGDFVSGAINVITEELEAMGESSLTSADKGEQSSVRWQNAQLKVGEKLLFVKNIWSDISGSVADSVATWADKWLPKIIKGFENVINYYIDIYNKSIAYRAVIEGVMVLFTTLFTTLKSGFKNAGELVVGFAKVMKAAFTLDFNAAEQAFGDMVSNMATNSKNAATQIKDSFKKAFDDIKEGSIVPVSLQTNVEPGKTTTKKNKPVGISEDTKKAIEAEKKAFDELTIFRIKQEAEKNRILLSDNQKGYDERTKALSDFVNKQIESIDQSEKFQLAQSGLTESQITLIKEKAEAERLKIEQEAEKTALQIAKDYVNERIRIINNLARANENASFAQESYEFAGLASEYAKGEIKAEEYEKRKTEMSKKYAKERFDTEVSILQEMLSISELSEEDRLKIQQDIKNAELDYNIYINEQLIKADEDAAKKREEIEKNLADKRKELISGLANFAVTAINSTFETQLNKLEKENEANQKAHDDQISRIEKQEETGAITKEEAEARKRHAEEQSAAKSEELEKKKAELQTKQAKFQKAASAMQTIVNTAQAVVAQLAATPLPLGAPLVAMVTAMGAVQLATILAQPIPKYAHGTDYHPGGLAIVGDGGRREAIVMEGRSYITPDVSTLVNLPKGAQVIPDLSLMQHPPLYMPSQSEKQTIVVQNDIDVNGVIKSNREVKQAIDRQNITIAKNISKSNINSYKSGRS